MSDQDHQFCNDCGWPERCGREGARTRPTMEALQDLCGFVAIIAFGLGFPAMLSVLLAVLP